MGAFKAACYKCGKKLYYEYSDDNSEYGKDLDIGKIKVEKICWSCLDNKKLEVVK